MWLYINLLWNCSANLGISAARSLPFLARATAAATPPIIRHNCILCITPFALSLLYYFQPITVLKLEKITALLSSALWLDCSFYCGSISFAPFLMKSLQSRNLWIFYESLPATLVLIVLAWFDACWPEGNFNYIWRDNGPLEAKLRLKLLLSDGCRNLQSVRKLG